MQFLEASHFFSLLLLVHPDIQALLAAAATLRQTYPHWPTLLVNEALSQALHPLPASSWPRQAPKIMRRLLRQASSDPLLCTEIDLLFTPEMNLDPLQLLRQASRSRPLIVLWSGAIHEGTLAYAVPAHAHYRQWLQPDLSEGCMVQLTLK